MMNFLRRSAPPLLAAAFAIGAVSANPPLAARASVRPDCASNHDLARVHRRLDGAIDQLSHDQRDYGGRRVDALGDLQRARTEIVAGEQYAIGAGHDNPACFNANGRTGGSDANWGRRGQGGSNGNLLSVRRWVERMIDQLQRDQRDYGGHRVAALNDLQQARTQLLAAEAYARGHGY
ncbi:MAG TPA: hypothetical protein VGN11_02985 [Candidatus Baltobacteraceae bacterium]|nr:hypothetical protein [Candidatus Baltobacteraceae bacterium]